MPEPFAPRADRVTAEALIPEDAKVNVVPALPTSTEVFDHAPDALFLVDDSGRILSANQRVRDLFGIAPARLCGEALETIIPLQAIQHQASIHTATSPLAGAVRVGRRADGTEFPIEVRFASIDRGARRWTLALIRDATEQHRVLDETLAALRAAGDAARIKGDFLGLAAHDLSQPVQTLEVTISAIEQCVGKSSGVAELAALAMSSLARMRELLKLLMEISRLESAALRIHEQPVQVAEIYEYLERQFGPVARAKGLAFITDAGGQIVETDPRLLRGMLSNLVSNSIRYTPAGEVRLSSRVCADGRLFLQVSDTGIGIPDDQMQAIFEDFRRLQQAETTESEGFGLGLGIVRRLSTLLQFPVRAWSSVGRGSTFAIEIPAGKVSECERVPE